jgi:hypothetical protein
MQHGYNFTLSFNPMFLSSLPVTSTPHHRIDITHAADKDENRFAGASKLKDNADG